MGQEILSVAIWTAIPGMEDAAFNSMRDITSIVTRKDYAREDLPYQDRPREDGPYEDRTAR